MRFGNGNMVAGKGAVWAEGAAVAGILAVAAHFLDMRIASYILPSGDEGSWMSVAVELARGNGFTTRWLENHWLEPYTLPRPDDFRYPALTGILALVFLVFGPSVEAALIATSVIFLLFGLAVFGVARRCYGPGAALGTLALTLFSLHQLTWNAAVYTEGLFGLVLAALIGWSLRPGADRRAWWVVLGAGVGLLYLVRPNGILFAPALALHFLWRKRKAPLPWAHLLAAFAAMLLVMSPWLARTALHFGNPFHFAGNAGLLRASPDEPTTWTLWEFLSRHGILFPLERLLEGSVRFFHALNFYEHGTHILPLLAAAGAALCRRPFYNAFTAGGFCLTFLACVYTAFNSWAGARYFSSFLPFVYAYGLAALLRLADTAFSRAPWKVLPKGARPLLHAALIAVLLRPYYHPHEHFERRLAHPPDWRRHLREHLDWIGSELEPRQAYYARRLCQVNFLTHAHCVGLNEFRDSLWLARSREKFRPRYIILTHAETKEPELCAALEFMRERGLSLDTVRSGELALYLDARPEQKR